MNSHRASGYARAVYALHRAALDPAPLLALREAILARFGHDGWLAEALVLPAVDALRRDPFVLGELARVFGSEPVPGQGDVVRVVAPSDEPTPPHRDGDYVRDPRTWTVWIPLGDCPRERGGLAVDDAGPWDYACGDVLMFDAQTLHRAGENATDRPRVSVDFRYVPS